MLDKLTPQFLKSLDGWLLKNQPLIWRTRIHWVVFGSLVVHLLVFVGFLLYPLTMTNLEGFDKAHFSLQVIGMLLGIFALLIWGFQTIKFPVKENHFTVFATIAIIYWFGCLAVGSNIWMGNVLFDQKVSGLLDKEELVDDVTFIQEFLNEDDRYWPYFTHKMNKGGVDLPKLILKYEIDLAKYEIAKDYKPIGAKFDEGFEYTLKDLITKVSIRQTIINSSHDAEHLATYRDDYRNQYLLILMVLLGLPILMLSLSDSNRKGIFAVVFLHFLVFIGLQLFASSQVVCWLYLLLFAIGVVISKQLKNSAFKKQLLAFISFTIPLMGYFLLYEG